MPEVTQLISNGVLSLILGLWLCIKTEQILLVLDRSWEFTEGEKIYRSKMEVRIRNGGNEDARKSKVN